MKTYQVTITAKNLRYTVIREDVSSIDAIIQAYTELENSFGEHALTDIAIKCKEKS